MKDSTGHKGPRAPLTLEVASPKAIGDVIFSSNVNNHRGRGRGGGGGQTQPFEADTSDFNDRQLQGSAQVSSAQDHLGSRR